MSRSTSNVRLTESAPALRASLKREGLIPKAFSPRVTEQCPHRWHFYDYQLLVQVLLAPRTLHSSAKHEYRDKRQSDYYRYPLIRFSDGVFENHLLEHHNHNGDYSGPLNPIADSDLLLEVFADRRGGRCYRAVRGYA